MIDGTGSSKQRKPHMADDDNSFMAARQIGMTAYCMQAPPACRSREFIEFLKLPVDVTGEQIDAGHRVRVPCRLYS
jgi:hypothetical protein